MQEKLHGALREAKKNALTKDGMCMTWYKAKAVCQGVDYKYKIVMNIPVIEIVNALNVQEQKCNMCFKGQKTFSIYM